MSKLGIRGNPPYLNHDLACPVKTDSSFWTTEDDAMQIALQKRNEGQTWSSSILGEGQLDPYSVDLEQKRLMLQRFHEEVFALLLAQGWLFVSVTPCVTLNSPNKPG